MRAFLIILGILILGIPAILSAQLYKYNNQKGILCFTDDYSMVPLDQRSSTQTIHEIQTVPPAMDTPDTQKEPHAKSEKSLPKKGGSKSELDQESKQLKMIKKKLADEYTRLNDRRDTLIIDGKQKMSATEMAAHTQEADKLKQEIMKYEAKRKSFLKRVEEYNLKLGSAI